MHTVEALDSLILFRQKPDSLLRRLMATEEAVRVAAQGELVALAVENGWQGDLWRCCIAWELVSSENPFSLTWERHPGGQDTLEALALADMKLFFEPLNAPPMSVSPVTVAWMSCGPLVVLPIQSSRRSPSSPRSAASSCHRTSPDQPW